MGKKNIGNKTKKYKIKIIDKMTKKPKNNNAIHNTIPLLKHHLTNKNNNVGINKTQKHYIMKMPILVGGKYIDKGAFGCVVSPALSCSPKDKNLDKLVSKIIRDPETNMNELKISAVLHKIDPNRKYYITYNKYCYIKQLPETREDIISVHYINDGLTKYSIDKDQEWKAMKSACDIDLSRRPLNLIMDYGGYSLTSIMKTDINKKGIKSLMHQLFVANVKEYFRHLVLGVVKMHNNRIVNRDIKQRNIMMSLNKVNNEVAVRYIDFGLSEYLTTEHCHNIENITRNGTPLYIPPEISISYLMRKYAEYPESYILKKIKNELNTNVKSALIKINERISLGNLDSIITTIYGRIKKLYDNGKILKVYFGSEKNKFNGYLQKADIYALGYSIYETLQVYSEIQVKKDEQLYDLLMKMIDLDVDKRYNAVQCLNHPYFSSKK